MEMATKMADRDLEYQVVNLLFLNRIKNAGAFGEYLSLNPVKEAGANWFHTQVIQSEIDQVQDFLTPAQYAQASALLTGPLNWPYHLLPDTPALADGREGHAYSQNFGTVGAQTPVTFSVVAGALPAGLSLSSGGALTGTLSTSGAGSYAFTVRSVDALTAREEFAYTLEVLDVALTPVAAALPAGTVSTPYSQTFSLTNGIAPVVFTVVAGALPAGLTLSSAGVLSGTPTLAGSYAFTVRATDAESVAVQKAYTLEINP